ncbi:hypothetical protein RhiirC2_789463 [Rhizophagus irregularis]|uniref:Uncharacterized protein n=1 Tax=Rhizophagus irregularis TaxID=588596 RepID=A0A2N1MN37_9GLOM|nr:hypothetical protein RhiirC2_789463 [Rhizophagus irregularis]
MIQIVKIPIIKGKINANFYNNLLNGYFTKEELTSRIKSFNLIYKTHQEKYVHYILLPFFLPIFYIIIILPIFIINRIHGRYLIGLIGVILPLIFIGCIIWYRIFNTKFKETIKREIKFLITTFNEYDYARHVHWRIIRERDNPKTTFPVVFLSKYEEYLTIDIVDNLYFYYNISSRFSSHSSNNSLIENFTIDSTTSIDNSTTLLSENSTTSIDDSATSIGSLNEDSTISIDDSTTSIGLLNENLSLTSPPPAYSLSYNSFYISSNFSNITHNTTINISENRQSIIDQQSVTNDRIHFFPSFLSNIPPPPPPPTYQEALDDDRVLFVEGRDQFGNEQVYFGMGRRGSLNPSVYRTQNRAVSTCTTVPLRDRTKASPQRSKISNPVSKIFKKPTLQMRVVLVII